MWLSFDAKLRIQLIPFGRQIFLLITALTNIDGNESYSRSSSSSSNKNNIKGEMRYVGQFIVRLKTPPLKTNKIRKFMDDKMGFPYPYPQPYPQSISALSMYMCVCVWVLEHGLTCTRTHLYTLSRRLLYNCGWILYIHMCMCAHCLYVCRCDLYACVLKYIVHKPKFFLCYI